MSLIVTENEDNLSVAASDFVQLGQPDADEVPDQQETQQQQEQPQFGLLHQNSLDWTMNTGCAHNYDNELKEQKLMMANLEVFLCENNIGRASSN
jgi:hypothetical protein